MTHRLTGRCHCGAVTVIFETPSDPARLQLRTCDCSFCRKHGGRTVSDPAGRLVFTVSDPTRLGRYRFGTGSADFLVCTRCGVYLGVVMEHEGRGYGVLNVNTLDDGAPFDRPAEPTHLGGESLDERMARRAGRWTPADVKAG